MTWDAMVSDETRTEYTDWAQEQRVIDLELQDREGHA